MRRKGDRVLGPYPDGRGRFRVITFTAGKRENTTFADRGEAEEAVRAAREEMAATAELTLSEAIGLYKKHLHEKRDRPATLVLADRFLGMFFPSHEMLLCDLTQAECQRFYDDCRTRDTARGKPPADATHQQALLQAQMFLTWCCERGLLRGENPAKGVKPVGKRRTGKPQLRIDEARRWLAKALELAPVEPGALAATVALLMGLRAGEIVSRTVRDLDDEGRILWVTGKTNEESEPRPVEVPEVLRPLLIAACAGKLPTAQIIERQQDVVAFWTRKICDLADIPVPSDGVHRLCAHSLRGLHATLAIQAGVTAHAVAATLGHSPQQTTAAYALPGSEQIAAARRAQMRLVR